MRGPVVRATLTLCGAAVCLPAPALTLAEAVRQALARNLSILVARAQLEGAGGAARQQLGSFDPRLTLEAASGSSGRPLRASERALASQAGVVLDEQRGFAGTGQAGVSRLFENGWSAAVVASHTATRDNTLQATGVPRQNTAAVSFQLRVPLLRNAGSLATAPLLAARAEQEAARAELEHSAAQTVQAAALAYWNLLARGQRLAVAQAGERRGDEMLEELRKLVAADERPRAELRLAEASLAEKRSARIAAEQDLQEARRDLGRALGLDAPAIAGLAAPGDPFPLPAAPVAPQAVEAAAARALAQRADLLALRVREQGAGVRADAAREAEKPQLDLVLAATRSGLAEGASAAAPQRAWSRGAEAGGTVGLQFAIPLGNHAAHGLTQQQIALLQATRARRDDLQAAIPAQVATAAAALRSAGEQVREADLAVAAYAAGLENERIRRRLGMATLIDVLNVEDRYNAALLAAIHARQAHAFALARLRFEAAELLVRDGERYVARVQALLDAALSAPEPRP